MAETEITGPDQVIPIGELRKIDLRAHHLHREVVNLDFPDLGNGPEGRLQSLQPVECSSMEQAAYYFKPQVTISPDPGKIEVDPESRREDSGEHVVDPSQSDRLERSTSIDDIIPGGSNPQRVAYWRNSRCPDERLELSFHPNRIVDSMRPEDPADDHLGALLRLRLHASAAQHLLNEIAAGERPFQDPEEKRAAVALERARLSEELKSIRGRLLARLDATPGARRSPQELRADSLSKDEARQNSDYREERERLLALAKQKETN